ncbi:hypothetical protein H5410_045689 [Solanum commersonii]|uniref:Uncharacterized protein n=1 Tax=Solanum commersonii TaxID=4109 RepID=A0A9J5XCC8_SOLCO|nr:hypothetical protein H5410_045689 [Solanum commersonii]
MIVLLMKPNQYWEAMFISLFSIETPAFIHLGVVLQIIEANYAFKSSRDGGGGATGSAGASGGGARVGTDSVVGGVAIEGVLVDVD